MTTGRPDALLARALTLTLMTLSTAGVLAADAPPVKPGQKLERRGDEIVVCGQLFHTTTPVVLWTDPGGYDAYRVERRFVPWGEASWEKTKDAQGAPRTPNRFSVRRNLTPERLEAVRGGGWDLEPPP